MGTRPDRTHVRPSFPLPLSTPPFQVPIFRPLSQLSWITDPTAHSLSLFSDLLLTEYPIPPTPFFSLFSSPTSSPTYFQSWRPVPDLLFQLSWVPDPTARMSVLRFPSLSQLSLSSPYISFPLSAELDTRPDRPLSLSLCLSLSLSLSLSLYPPSRSPNF